MCGKDILWITSCYTQLGSPPHVRERLSLHDDYLIVRMDHPRMCGKDSNGSLYFRPFTPADIQNLFNFFAKHLTSSASPNAR